MDLKCHRIPVEGDDLSLTWSISFFSLTWYCVDFSISPHDALECTENYMHSIGTVWAVDEWMNRCV